MKMFLISKDPSYFEKKEDEDSKQIYQAIKNYPNTKAELISLKDEVNTLRQRRAVYNGVEMQLAMISALIPLK